jgi:pSer/pThr/pTyr-binding forkhead associated (FHA) protein
VHQASASELKERIAAERAGHAFLILRDSGGSQRLIRLDAEAAPVTIGRGAGCALRIEWDVEMSRVHAELLCLGGDWTLADDGLSRNGSFVNGERVVGRRRLRDGDQLTLGVTPIVFRRPQANAPDRTTLTSTDRMPVTAVSDAQRRVLVALCRPFGDDRGFASPARNQEIADELYLSVAAVKTHLRALFSRFGIEELPQNEKRLRLVELAFRSGIVTEHDLRPPLTTRGPQSPPSA